MCAHHVVVFVLCAVCLLLPQARPYDCVEKCGYEHTIPTLYQSNSKEHCFIALPDNPLRNGNKTLPCQMEMKSNCSTFCHLEIDFAKFDLSPCVQNWTLEQSEAHCSHVTHCEYVLLYENGRNSKGQEVRKTTRFHGIKTDHVFKTETNHVTLQFCYRSETFSARNIQMQFTAVDPEAGKGFNPGPLSVYVLSGIVVLLIITVFVVAFGPCLRPCLDPQPQRKLLADLEL